MYLQQPGRSCCSSVLVQVCILPASRASRSHEQLSLLLAPCHSGVHTRDFIARRIREAPSTSLLFIYIECTFQYSNNTMNIHCAFMCIHTYVYPFIHTAICTSTELHHRPILFFGPSRTNGRFFRIFNKSFLTKRLLTLIHYPKRNSGE